MLQLVWLCTTVKRRSSHRVIVVKPERRKAENRPDCSLGFRGVQKRALFGLPALLNQTTMVFLVSAGLYEKSVQRCDELVPQALNP